MRYNPSMTDDHEKGGPKEPNIDALGMGDSVKVRAGLSQEKLDGLAAKGIVPGKSYEILDFDREPGLGADLVVIEVEEGHIESVPEAYFTPGDKPKDTSDDTP